MNNPQPKSFNPTNPNPKPNLTDNGSSRSTAPSFSTSECSNCSSNKRWFLHNVRIRGIFRRLCTSCVLRLHASSFCPSCFQLHEPTNIPSSTKRLTCSKCSSFTHSHCAPSSAHPSSSYLCPPCASPNFTFFDIDYDPNIRIMEKRHALAFYCATKIASASMSKSKVVAASEAERRAREAAVARKRARESLEQLAAVVQARRFVAVSGSVAKLGLDKDVKKKPPLSVIDGSSNKKMNNGNAIALDRSSINGNGNVNENEKEKEKSGDVSKPEEIDITKMDINQKSTRGSQENVASN